MAAFAPDDERLEGVAVPVVRMTVPEDVGPAATHAGRPRNLGLRVTQA